MWSNEQIDFLQTYFAFFKVKMSFASKSHLAKGPVKGLFQKFKFFNNARPELYGGSYAKNLAAESPELIAAFFIVSFSFS